MNQQWVGTVGIALLAGILIWVLLFGWCIVLTVYNEHENLVANNELLQKQIEVQRSPQFNLPITGFVISGLVSGGTRLQITASPINSGRPSIAHKWGLVLHTATHEEIGVWVPGEKPAAGSLTLPALDEALRTTPLGVAERPGLLYFVFKNVPPLNIEKLRDDKSATLILLAVDDLGREWRTETSITELAKQRFERSKNK